MPPEHEEWAEACRRASAERRERDLISHLLGQQKNAAENARLFERNKEEKRRKMEERSVQRNDIFDMQKIIPPISLPKEKDNNIPAKKQAKLDVSAQLPKQNPTYNVVNPMANRAGQLSGHPNFGVQNPPAMNAANSAAMFPQQQQFMPFFYPQQGGQYMPSAQQMAAFNFANGGTGGGNFWDAADAQQLNRLMHLNGALNFPQNFQKLDSQKLANSADLGLEKSQQNVGNPPRNSAKAPPTSASGVNSLGDRFNPVGTAPQQQSQQNHQQQQQCQFPNNPNFQHSQFALQNCYHQQQQQQQQTFTNINNNNMFFNPPYFRQQSEMKATVPVESPFAYNGNFPPNASFLPNNSNMMHSNFAGQPQFSDQQPNGGSGKVDCNDMFARYVANPLANNNNSSPCQQNRR